MKTKYIVTVMAVAVASIAFAGNDPKVSVHNYKHPAQATQAQKNMDAQNGQDITVVVKETNGPENYKNNFQKATYKYVKAKANQETYPSNSKPQSHNYKNQFQF